MSAEGKGMLGRKSGDLVLSRDGAKKGETTGSQYRCSMDGCTGLRVVVRWSDGKVTRPCSKGLRTLADGSLQIA